MASTSLCLVTPRDRDLFQALDRSPLTVRQLLALSTTFAYPFTTERRVQERLHCLAAAGRVRRWRYATAGQGALSYYTLSPLGYRLLHGFDTVPSRRGLFGPVGVARQAHTRTVADVLVQLFVSAARAEVRLDEFRRENSLRLQVDDASLYPDGAFVLERGGTADRYTFYIEVDNRSETVRGTATLDTWQRKVQFYERLQDVRPDRFRVLAITTGGAERLRHMMECAAELARNPRRSLVYGITIADFLAATDPLTHPVFRNHMEQFAALLPDEQRMVMPFPLEPAARDDRVRPLSAPLPEVSVTSTQALSSPRIPSPQGIR